MAVNITYFVHGTTIDNEQDVSSGWSDAELSELGVEQAIKLKQLTKDKKFDTVFCSDLKRATNTAHMAFDGSAPVIPDKRLRECNYGTYNGKPSSMVEPMAEVKARIADFMEFLKKNYDGKHVAIVAHKAPQLALDVLLKGKTWQQAFAEDWRNTKSWQPGWEYILK